METRGNMTEKEQKAIDWLKNSNFFSARIYAPSILNLIEKQQKELKKLNIDIEARKEEKCLLIEDMNKYYDICIQQQKEIEELKTCYVIKPRELEKEINKEWQDKIKNEIKELEKMELTEGDIFFVMRDYTVLILKELLEE